MSLDNHMQMLKCCDDHCPVKFYPAGSPSDARKQFRLDDGSSCAWAKPDQCFGTDILRSRIEPWLTALFQSEHLSVLVGSGLTHALHYMATGKKLPGMRQVSFVPDSALVKGIESEAARSARATGRENGNVEDQIRVATELLRGLEILAAAEPNEIFRCQIVKPLREGIEKVINDFAVSILKGEYSLASAPGNRREETFNYLVSFLMSFASRTGTRDRLHLFTTNYDRFIEAGADSAGLRLIDRFVGTLAPIFRASRLDIDMHYNPPGIRGEPRYLEGVARFTKLHGSVDWVDSNHMIRRIGLPFGADDLSTHISGYGFEVANAMQLMIYPNAAKDRETALYPYVELFRDFAAAICRPNSTLVCYGYSFGDEHINRIIEDMLTIPSAHLVIISHGDPLGRVINTYVRLGRPAQITLLLGDHLGDFKTLVDHYLPKPAIDRTTFRMAELLKARWGIREDNKPEGGDKSVLPPALTAEGEATP